MSSRNRGSRSSKGRVDSDGDDDSPRGNASRNSSNQRGNSNVNQDAGGNNLPSILVNTTKNELKTLNNGFKSWAQKFRSNYRFVPNKEDLSNETLKKYKAVVFGGSRVPFDASEVNELKNFLNGGGGVVILGSDGSTTTASSNPSAAASLPDDPLLMSSSTPTTVPEDDFTHINRLTQPYGISLSPDGVVRTVYAKEFFHPKEVLIKKAAVVATLDALAIKKRKAENGDNNNSQEEPDFERPSLTVCYSYGCSLSVVSPAVPLVTSGVLSFPANRALVAVARVGKGTLVVCGSATMFDDSFLGKEDNELLLQNIFQRATTESKLENVDKDRAEYGESQSIPDTEALAERLRGCLQEAEELPVDFTQLFDHNLFKFDTNLIPEAVQLYTRLNVKHEPLSLIPPQFEVPLPPLQPAVFMPCMRELPAPALDLYDLDEHFSSEKNRLAQLTNKCTDKDLEYYICDAGEILGIADQIRSQTSGSKAPPKYNANRVLEHILKKLMDWKKLDQDGFAEHVAAHVSGLSGDDNSNGNNASLNSSSSSSSTGIPSRNKNAGGFAPIKEGQERVDFEMEGGHSQGHEVELDLEE